MSHQHRQKSPHKLVIADRRNRAGFTIAELVITIVLMGIIIPAIALALTNLSVVNYQARDLALANMIAQNKVETLRSAGYNSVSIGTQNFTAELPASMGKQRTASYSVSLPQTGIKQVDINISYTEYKSTKNLAFRTYISELGVGQ
jgi:prepilin-type N-terminal cleavage/methylation domain-containing protein